METLSFRQPRLVALTILVLIAAGLSSLLSIARQEDPTITNLFASVTTAFPGADPARVEALVTAEIEEQLRTIAEVDTLESTSSTGVSIVQVELVETIDPDRIEQVWSEIRDALEDARREMPPGVLPPDFNSEASGTYTAIVALAASHSDVPMAIAGRYADALSDQLRNIPGTKLVETFGTPEEEILVTLDAEAAAALGLTADQVSAAILAADSKVSAGRLRGDGQDLVLAVEGEIETLERLSEIVVREDAAGRLTRLADIAVIERAERRPVLELALDAGRDAILVGARLEEGLQVDVWMGYVREEVAAFAADLPASLEADLVFDQSTYTSDRLTEVGTNMAIGVGLVVAVLFLTLGWRSAVIVAAILPLVSLATLATMNIIGLPIHQMSVTGLIVALGLLVDAAIVMTDEVGQRLRAGRSRVEAVGGSVRRLFGPLLASTLTTVLSFMPMILLPGPAGDFVGSIALAVVMMLLWSFVLAIAITPALSGWLLNGRSGGIPGGPVARLFRASLSWAIANPVKSVALALVLPVTGFASFPSLTAQFFPGVERDQFHIEVEMAPGTAIRETERTARAIDKALRAQPEVAQVSWVVGRSAPAFYYNIVGGRDRAPGFAQALVTTQSPEATRTLLTRLQDDLSRDFPAARILVRGLVQGPPVNAPVELRFVGPEVETLQALGAEARRIVAGLDMVTIVRTSLPGGAPKVNLAVDEAQAEMLGLDLGQIARQLEAALEGVTGGSLLEGTERLPVRVRMGEEIRGDLAAIRDLAILPPGAAATSAEGRYPGVPLSALADVTLVPADTAITRRNAERVNTVQAFLIPDVLPEEALVAVRETLAAENFTLPEGYRLEIGGDSDARASTLGNLLASLGIIVTLSIATIVLTFNSFRLSMISFVVAGLSAGLSLLALAVFQYPFGIQAVIGVIGSIGVSINAAIIILTGLQADERARNGDREGMVDVVMGSSRHIVSTTITTFGGFLPLILAGGGFWPPFAMSIAGGVLLSTVVSFYFTPQMFALVYARRTPETAKKPVLVLTPATMVRPMAAE
ncbi:MAG: efflux RND transporter permease subunit [Pseudomonadota bacterium]